MTTAPDAILAAAAADLDQGLAQAALAKLEGHHEDPDALLLISEALLALGEVDSAHQSFASAAMHLDDSDPDVIWIRAELALADWELERAARDYQSHIAAVPSSLGFMRLALVHDAMDQGSLADAKELQARALDPHLPPLQRLRQEEFEAIIQSGLEQLRVRYPAEADQVKVIHARMPTPELSGERPQATPPDLLGLYVAQGPDALVESAPHETSPTIYLFQRNLERMGLDRAGLEEEIRKTLFHEFGYLLGLDEDGIAAAGLA